MTDAERLLWRHLRLRQVSGLKFRRQQPLGPYVADFVSFEKRLIVEVDGGQHLEQAARDGKRDEWLASQGFRILRFWNNQVLNEIDAVLEEIIRVSQAPPTPALPRQGGGRP